MSKRSSVAGNLAVDRNEPKVIVIDAKAKVSDVRLRVAPYTRVSSNSEDQLNSFAAQNHYYTELVSKKDNWELVDIYADEGITGTSALKRPDFQRLMADCRRGRVDRILCKSLSRFARNTKECLEALRELKKLGVSVFFEKENIDTAKMSGEIVATLMAAFAQAESESISGNLRWSYQKRMQSGAFITCRAPFGYNLVEGRLEINEEEAAIVKKIFEWYLAGRSLDWIADMITKLEVPRQEGKTDWRHSAIAYIIRNEKYIGDSLLQKKYSTDTLPFQKKLNHGEKDQYYVQNSHPAIIEREVFEEANALLAKRVSRIEVRGSMNEALRRKIVCGNCGTLLKQKRHNDRVFWTCRKHDRDRLSCPLTQVPEEQICEAFLKMYYKLKNQGMDILCDMYSDLRTIRERRMLWSLDVIEMNKRISELSSQYQTLAELKKRGLVDPDFFISQTNELTEQLREAKLEKERLVERPEDQVILRTGELMETIESGPDILEEFDGELFSELVDVVIIESRDVLRFRLKNGLELTETIERERR